MQRNAAFRKDVIDYNGSLVRNGGYPTYSLISDNHQGKSVSDLTLANRPIPEWFIMAHDHATRSVHKVIE